MVDTVKGGADSESVLLLLCVRRGLMALPAALSEQEALADFKALMSQNEVFRSHIGAGYYNNYTPTVILRNILENPGQNKHTLKTSTPSVRRAGP